jgi:putative nuclease YbcO-like protein
VSLRDLARGKPCMVRLPGICNGNEETTILAHYRMAGTCGMGMKPDDFQGSWACSSCHDECDRRTRILENDFVELCFVNGMTRTQYRVMRDYPAILIAYIKSRFLNSRTG